LGKASEKGPLALALPSLALTQNKRRKKFKKSKKFQKKQKNRPNPPATRPVRCCAASAMLAGRAATALAWAR
jgi:hypothetical protein